MNSRIFTNHPIYEFRLFSQNLKKSYTYAHSWGKNHENPGFLKIAISMMEFHAKNFKKSDKGWIRKNPEIHPSYHFCNFSLKIPI